MTTEIVSTKTQNSQGKSAEPARCNLAGLQLSLSLLAWSSPQADKVEIKFESLLKSRKAETCFRLWSKIPQTASHGIIDSFERWRVFTFLDFSSMRRRFV